MLKASAKPAGAAEVEPVSPAQAQLITLEASWCLGPGGPRDRLQPTFSFIGFSFCDAGHF